jgi:Zn-dependent peptidase ImmA (M78 family)/transcriptional regulator with XRE-family HTH domain
MHAMSVSADHFSDLVGQRVQFARKEMGLTQDDVAARIGFKDRQIVASIEAGKRRVAADELLRLMEILRKSLDYFTDPYLIVTPNAISWRAQNVPVILDQYEPKARTLVSAGRRFADLLGEKPMPLAYTLPLTKRSTFEEAAEAGDFLSGEWGAGDVPAAMLQQIVEERLRYLVLFVDCPAEISGAACHVSGADAILINRREGLERQNFDLGHEVFHLLTWDTMPPERIDAITENTQGGTRTECLANNFAAGLLMPVRVLKPRWESRGDTEIHAWLNQTATELQVSGQALYWRLRNLKLMSDGIALGVDTTRLVRHGQGGRDLNLRPPYSATFTKRLHRVLDNGLVSARKAAELLDCSLDDIADVFGAYNLPVPFDL